MFLFFCFGQLLKKQKNHSIYLVKQFKVIRYLCFLGDEALIAELFPFTRLLSPGE